jgi:hypothetical protein
MNYQRIYDELIDNARLRILTGYKERHHIVPKCMGGTDDKDNLVNLTAKEHFIAHKLLCEIYVDNEKLKEAYWAMSIIKTDNRSYHISNNEYERLKKIISEVKSKRLTGLPTWNKGKKLPSLSEETKQKMRIAAANRKPISEETRKKISNAHKGKKLSVETKQKMSEAKKGKNHPNYGKLLSEETKQKMRKPKQKIKYEI